MAFLGPRGPADEISQRLWAQYAKRDTTWLTA
jgi:hypothetical protein